MIKYLWLFCLIPTLLYGAAGDVVSVSGKAVTAISTISGVAGASIATLCGKNYSDGDATCNTASNKVGDTTEGASHYEWSNGYAVCTIATADCIGSLSYGKLYHYGTESDGAAKLALYSRNSTGAPDSGDLKIAVSESIAESGADELITTASELSGSITSTTAGAYWICIFTTVNGFDAKHTAGSAGDGYWIGSVDFYASPPDNLDPGAGSWTSWNNVLSAYITIK